MSTDSVKNIHWLGHASFRIDGVDVTIYIDPWQLSDDSIPADLILITHDHHDHCSPEDVAKIQVQDTTIITVKVSADRLHGDVVIVRPGDSLNVKGIPILVVPAYNVNKYRSPGVVFHPKEKGYVGFVITLDDKRIYHAGDTDVIPEMSDFEADIALLPVSGKYVMTADEALEAIRFIHPEVIIPMHIGRGIGSQNDAEKIKSKSPVPVVILPIENE
jgi:L-ascorbate metabolism protein UlaG (beta-lactamase superfamily)